MTNYVMDMTVWAVFTSWMLQHAAQGKGVRLREIFTGIDIEMSKEENYVIYRKELEILRSCISYILYNPS